MLPSVRIGLGQRWLWSLVVTSRIHRLDPEATFGTKRTSNPLEPASFLAPSQPPVPLLLVVVRGRRLMAEPGPIGQGQLLPSEEPWVARFEFLRQNGYLLRPRYRPGWVAPWTLKPGLYSRDFEESISITVSFFFFLLLSHILNCLFAACLLVGRSTAVGR